MRATKFYQKLAGRNLITTREGAQLTGLSIPAASMALRRLAAEKLCIPLKRGHWSFGNSATKPGILLTAAADPYQAYLSGWSAMRIHDRIQQIPQKHFGITLGRPGEIHMAGTNLELHCLVPALFGGYNYEARVEGFVASPEKALFDLAYLAAMNRSTVSGNLPETDLRHLKWREVNEWIARIPSKPLRQVVEKNLRRIRKTHEETRDEL